MNSSSPNPSPGAAVSSPGTPYVAYHSMENSIGITDADRDRLNQSKSATLEGNMPNEKGAQSASPLPPTPPSSPLPEEQQKEEKKSPVMMESDPASSPSTAQAQPAKTPSPTGKTSPKEAEAAISAPAASAEGNEVSQAPTVPPANGTNDTAPSSPPPPPLLGSAGSATAPPAVDAPQQAPEKQPQHEELGGTAKNGSEEPTNPAKADGTRSSPSVAPAEASPKTKTGSVRFNVDAHQPENAPAKTAPPSSPPAKGTAAPGKAPPSAAAAPPPPTPPDYLVFRKDPDLDSVGTKAILEALTNPSTFNTVRAAFRASAFICLPMFTIAIHPNTMLKLQFPQMLIASVMSTSILRPTLGEHIGVASWTWRGIALMVIVGTLFCTFNLPHHLGAWWGMIATVTFCISLVSHGNMRRFMYLYIFVYMMQLRQYDMMFLHVPVSNAAWFCADLIIGSLMGVAANLFPYPLLTKTLVDMILGKLFEGVGKMVMGMSAYMTSPDPHAAALFFNDYSGFSRIEGILSVIPALLWFCNWEPLEFPIRNPIRRLKLSLMRRILALCYAAFSTGRTVVTLRRYQADRIALYHVRRAVWGRAMASRANQRKMITGSPAQGVPDVSSPNAPGATDDKDPLTQGYLRILEEEFGTEEMLRVKAENEQLQQNTKQYVKLLSVTLMNAITLVGSTESRPEELLKKIPFDELSLKDAQMRRNMRVEILQILQRQHDVVARRRLRREQMQREKDEPFNNPDDGSVFSRRQQKQEEHQPGYSPAHDKTPPRNGLLEPSTMGYSDEEASTLADYFSITDSANVFIGLNEVFFVLLLSMISTELHAFGEMMKDYKPAKPLGRRLLEYFILEPWHDFWEELWFRITFPRPSDYRVVKDAVKMTCAYLAACVFSFEIWIPQGGLYFFGMTIILGLPSEEESVGINVKRMAGHTLGCALGYFAYHNVDNFAQMIACTCCFVFICFSFRNHAGFGDCFFYAGIMVMAGAVTSTITMEFLTRLVAAMYAAAAYMLCCLMIFPTNSVKICCGYRAKLTKVVSELIDDVALTARQRIAYDPRLAQTNDDSEDGRLSSTLNSTMFRLHNTNTMQMCSQLNVELSLMKRLQAMAAKWAPIAVHQPMIRGMLPFPAEASQSLLNSQHRLVASVQLMVFGVQLLHRPRSTPPEPEMVHLFRGSVAVFLAEFAGGVRLVSQSIIDSMQWSRKWSNPVFLGYVANLSRMRVRIQAIMFELYVTVGQRLGESAMKMMPGDFDRLRQEATEAELGSNASHEPFVEVRADDPDARERELNATFASQYLQARREAAELGPDAPEDAKEELRNSFIVPNKSFILAATKGYHYQAPLMEAEMVPKDAFPYTQDNVERDMAQELKRDRHHEELERSRTLGGTVDGTAGDTGERSNVLDDAEDRAADPTSHAPDQPESLKGSMAQRRNEPFQPIEPDKDGPRGGRDVSHLVLLPEKGPETHVPLYRGPGFSYREDELDLPIDTDFLALVSLLSSCHSFIGEMEQITTAVNAMSSYLKQLHETTLILPLIDKMSNSIEALRKSNYDRYHYPPPPPEQRLPVNTQSDPWKDWRF